MYLSRKQKDADRIANLAQLCRGKARVAVVLAARLKGISTLDGAIDAVEKSPALADDQFANISFLYYRRVSDAMAQIQKLRGEIDFDLVATLSSGEFSTQNKFERIVSAIKSEIDGSAGVTNSVKRAVDDELRRNDSREPIFRLMAEINKAADEVKGLCWRLLNRWVYVVTDPWIITGFLAFAVLAVPIWYLYGPHHAANLNVPPSAAVNADLLHLQTILSERDGGIWTRAATAMRFIFDAVMLLPTMFLIPAVVLSTIRRAVPSSGGHLRLRGIEQQLYELGTALQSQVPKPGSAPNITFGRTHVGDTLTTQTGDINKVSAEQVGAVGRGAQGTINNYNGAWKQIEKDVDLAKVSGELITLLKVLDARKTLGDNAQLESMMAISAAKMEADAGRGPGMMEKLAKAGKWALDVAKEIGVEIVAAVILKSMGVKADAA